MKATRLNAYQIPGYGQITFSKRDAGSGHTVWRVVWTWAGSVTGTPIAWLRREEKPSAKLAVFFAKQACSIEDGFDRNHYHDKGLTPPPRVPEPVAALARIGIGPHCTGTTVAPSVDTQD
jgi:hypothetical protein